ncbi:hypothetical protein NDU88_002976 [Pleurodeles waltl]|uniref:Uncharacterized protein n=1 Tax=Pleurodeles waltl TaxID=8319 RepID=A0AAV7T4E6_PLEWA|nr:hypothetical protein NDU88_002976 [Pleurodeles waltl]
MCAPHSTTSKEFRRAAGAVRWYRAALELRRSRKNAARIPLRGNSGSASGNIRAAGAVFEKRRLGERLSEQPKEISEFDARRKTVRQSGEGGVFLAPPPPFTTVEGTAQLSQDSTVPIIEEKGGLVKKKTLRLKPGEGGRSAGRKAGESKLKGRDRLTPSLRSFFKVRPEVVTLIPGQVRAVMEDTTRQAESILDEGREGARSSPPGLEERMATVLVQTPNNSLAEVQDHVSREVVSEMALANSGTPPFIEYFTGGFNLVYL